MVGASVETGAALFDTLARHVHPAIEREAEGEGGGESRAVIDLKRRSDNG